jgi:hypothetical protein
MFNKPVIMDYSTRTLSKMLSEMGDLRVLLPILTLPGGLRARRKLSWAS